MSKDDVILDIILGAIRRETEAFRYYSDASKQSPYPETSALLRQLAEEERKHRRILVQEFANVKKLLSPDSQEQDDSLLEANRIRYHLPAELPFQRVRTVPGIDLAAVSLPTHFISGDYVESYPVHLPEGADGQLGLLLSDVMGHGMEAVSLKAGVRQVLGEIADDDWERLSQADRLVESLNRNLHPLCQKAAGFVTLCYVLLDLQRGEMSYVSAGHELPVLIDSAQGQERPLEGNQLLIGLDRDQKYSLERASLRAGDMIVLFSDGIMEAFNPREEEFGRQRLVESLIESRSQDARGIVKSVFGALDDFLKNEALTDEATLAVAKLKEVDR